MSALSCSSNCPGIDRFDPAAREAVHISCRDRRAATRDVAAMWQPAWLMGGPAAQTRAAALSKGRRRSSKSCRSIPSTATGGLSRLAAGGRISTPWGNTLQIVPDVFADHILHRANIPPQGDMTGKQGHSCVQMTGYSNSSSSLRSLSVMEASALFASEA